MQSLTNRWKRMGPRFDPWGTAIFVITAYWWSSSHLYPIYIVFSMFSVCLGSWFKNEEYTLCLACACRALHLACVWVRTLFKNEEYTYCMYVALFMQIQMAYRSAVYFSTGTNGTNRQLVYARPSVVNICSLQMVTPIDWQLFHWNRFVPIVPMAPIDKATLTNGDRFTSGTIGKGV